MRRYRRSLILGMGSLILKDAAHASVPLIIRSAIDALTALRPYTVVLRFALLLIAVALVRGIFQFWMRVILIGMSRDVEYDLRNDMFAHLVSLSPDFYARQRTGDIMARATNDLNAVRMMLGPGIMYWFETSLTFALAIAVMAFYDWRLTVFAV
ncbi:MAG: transporter related, partial [Bryobacterales bacterium]|nr:transporter related [Bryobacterales bacterium]